MPHIPEAVRAPSCYRRPWRHRAPCEGVCTPHSASPYRRQPATVGMRTCYMRRTSTCDHAPRSQAGGCMCRTYLRPCAPHRAIAELRHRAPCEGACTPHSAPPYRRQPAITSMRASYLRPTSTCGHAPRPQASGCIRHTSHTSGHTLRLRSRRAAICRITKSSGHRCRAPCAYPALPREASATALHHRTESHSRDAPPYARVSARPQSVSGEAAALWP